METIKINFSHMRPSESGVCELQQELNFYVNTILEYSDLNVLNLVRYFEHKSSGFIRALYLSGFIEDFEHNRLKKIVSEAVEFACSRTFHSAPEKQPDALTA